jgi:hypothetical protein
LKSERINLEVLNMTYDWDGKRTRIARFVRLTLALTAAAAVPAAVLAWPYLA